MSLANILDNRVLSRNLGGPPIARDFPWNCFGQRDPAILTNENGDSILSEDGLVTVCFNARDRALREGGITCVGIATGLPNAGWCVSPVPFFSDGPYAAAGCILRLASDEFRIYYSPNTSVGFSISISNDFRNWQNSRRLSTLTPDAFGVTRIGLPYVRALGGVWIMFFEGLHKGRFNIYQALSADGIRWQPGNNGNPIYSPPPGNWDCYGQANPSFYSEVLANGSTTYFILYNGCSAAHGWDIGLLRSKAPEGPWHGQKEPLLRRGAMGPCSVGRLEGARYFCTGDKRPWIACFGLPSADSYRGGEIFFTSATTATCQV
jgi:hypothetical protein